MNIVWHGFDPPTPHKVSGGDGSRRTSCARRHNSKSPSSLHASIIRIFHVSLHVLSSQRFWTTVKHSVRVDFLHEAHDVFSISPSGKASIILFLKRRWRVKLTSSDSFVKLSKSSEVSKHQKVVFFFFWKYLQRNNISNITYLWPNL